MHDFVKTCNVAAGKDVRLRRLQALVDNHRVLFGGFDSGILQTKSLDGGLTAQRIEDFLSFGNLLFAVPFVPDTFPGRSSFEAHQLCAADRL